MRTGTVPEPTIYLEFEDDAGVVYPVTIKVREGNAMAAEDAARTIAIAYGGEGLELKRVTRN